jgi:DNA-binding response OmpR family regulator
MSGALLFVDDDADLRALIPYVAASLGFERCVLAASLVEVEAQRSEALSCSLAVLDINLGWASATGVDVYNWLRQQRFAGRIVFLTGHGEDDPRVRDAARIGGARVLVKPIALDVLAELATEAVGGR